MAVQVRAAGCLGVVSGQVLVTLPCHGVLGCPGSLGMRGVGGSGVTKMQTPLSLVFIKNYLNDTESFVFIRLIFINCDYFILLTCSHFMCWSSIPVVARALFHFPK